MNFDNIVLLVLRLKIIKMIRITNLIILSILFFVFQVSGINFPDFWFEHITIADGLSQNYIRTDSFGSALKTDSINTMATK